MLYLKYASQLFVEKADKLFAFIILLGERKNHAAHWCQQLEGADLIHVFLIKELKKSLKNITE